MGPKKGKEATTDEYFWRTSIEQARLDDDSWSVKVIMIEAAGSDQDRIYLNKFEVFAAEEKRFVIKNICKTETIFMVNQLGGEKKVKDDSLRVFEEGQAYLKEKRDIPPDIQALIVKHLILKMKEEYLFIKRQRLQVREGMSRESATMLGKAEVRGTVNVKPPEPLPPPPLPPTKKGKKGETELENAFSEPDDDKKYNTLLRVRGEEWRDKVYVDDFPTDGPSLYVAVTGFVEPLLVGCLLKIGVPLNAVIQIRIDPTKIEIPSSLLRATKRGQSQTDILTQKSLKYWEDLQQLRISNDSADDLKNTAFVIFSPPYWDAESLSGNPDKIYDELCFLMYDIQDLTRQHFHYLENMDIINIPQEKGEIRYQKYYYQQIDEIPLECVTAYAVLDSIIQTVCKIPNLQRENSRSTFSSDMGLHQQAKNQEEKEKQAEAIVKDVFNALCMTDSTKTSYRLTYGEEYESHKDPTVIKHGDAARLSTFHLENNNMDNVVFSMLLGMPVNKLWHNKDRPEGVIEAKVNFHVNVLLSCFKRKDVETAELSRLLHILACRKLFNNRSSLKKRHLGSATVSEFKKVYLKRSVLAEPLPKCPSLFSVSSTTSPKFPSMTKRENSSDLTSGGDTEEERIRFLFDCPDISELVSAAEISNDQALKHIIDDFEYFEDFTGSSAFQVLRDAFNKFNCVDYKYCEVTDCYVMMFYNSHDKEGIARDEWRCHLPTPLCLQDFFDFILEEHYDWIKREEKIYDENIAMYSSAQSKVSINPFALESCIENADVSTELLMEGSLKFQGKVALENSFKEDSSNNAFPIRKSHIDSELNSESSRKTKSMEASSKRHTTSLYLASDDGLKTSVFSLRKPFQGYDLGDRRVEVFGKDGIYYSKDGTRVSSLYTLLIPFNLEYVILNVVPGNGHNEFWVHRALGDFVLPEILTSCESFRITSKDQVMINVKKQIYQVPIPITTESTTENHKSKEAVLKSTSELLHQIPTVFESKYFHSLYITWPNGSITETIYEDNSPTLSHVKQFYTQSMPKLDEEMRCISLNGEVIVFKASGDVDVLRPDGSFIKIIKYGKKLRQVAQEDVSEVSSDKQKKTKGKEKMKVKEKTSKISSRSSKNTLQLDDVTAQDYELFIDEFETIHTNGLRQKWIGESSFDLNKLLIRTATDYCLGQIYSRRMDGTNILLNKDGVQVVTFPNQTRIITQFTVEEEEVYPEWTKEEMEYYFDVFSDNIEENPKLKPSSVSQKSNVRVNYSPSSVQSSMSRKITEEEELEEPIRNDGYISVQISFTIEHANFASVTINKADGKVTVDSPNNTSVVLDIINNHYEFHLDEVTRASFDGESLHIDYEACPECKSNTTCDIKICHDEMCSVTKVNQNWLKMKDSFCRKIVVNEEGCINLLDDTSDYSNENITQTGSLLCPDNTVITAEPEHVELVDEERMPDAKSESSFTSHGKCREMYQAKTLRFFILKRELTCSELVHRALLDQYKTVCRWQPWCSIGEHNTFGDHRSLVSVLTPVHLTETEKWLMDSKLASKPAFLAYKDLKKDLGKGFYHWMRPYGRFEPQPMKPANVLPPRLPRAFIMRILEKQWKEKERHELSGAKELSQAILRYRRLMEVNTETLLHVAILDPRPEDERRVDDIVQALGCRVYEDLKTRLEDDVQSRTKPDVTTRTHSSIREPSVEGEMEDDFSEVRLLEEERESHLREAEAVLMRPSLARYWRRRAEELKEEQFYLYLLREGSVPPYYRNLLGGAIWWEMNHTAGEAVTVAERRKMKCFCEFPPPPEIGVTPTLALNPERAGDAKDVAGAK